MVTVSGECPVAHSARPKSLSILDPTLQLQQVARDLERLAAPAHRGESTGAVLVRGPRMWLGPLEAPRGSLPTSLPSAAPLVPETWPAPRGAPGRSSRVTGASEPASIVPDMGCGEDLRLWLAPRVGKAEPSMSLSKEDMHAAVYVNWRAEGRRVTPTDDPVGLWFRFCKSRPGVVGFQTGLDILPGTTLAA